MRPRRGGCALSVSRRCSACSTRVLTAMERCGASTTRRTSCAAMAQSQTLVIALRPHHKTPSSSQTTTSRSAARRTLRMARRVVTVQRSVCRAQTRRRAPSVPGERHLEKTASALFLKMQLSRHITVLSRVTTPLCLTRTGSVFRAAASLVRGARRAARASACRATATLSLTAASAGRGTSARRVTALPARRVQVVRSSSTRRTASLLATVPCTMTAGASSASSRMSLSQTAHVASRRTAWWPVKASAYGVPMGCLATRAASASVCFIPHLTNSVRRVVCDMRVQCIVLPFLRCGERDIPDGQRVPQQLDARREVPCPCDRRGVSRLQ